MIFWYQFTPRKLLMISVHLVKFGPHWLSVFFILLLLLLLLFFFLGGGGTLYTDFMVSLLFVLPLHLDCPNTFSHQSTR